MKRLILTLSLILLLSTGCASLGIRGSVQDNHYTSPNGSFRVQIPLRGNIRDEALATPEGWQVKFWDDFCRIYSISEIPGDLKGLSFETWVDQIVMPEQKGLKADLLERKILQTRYGPMVFLRYRLPEASPCIKVQFKEGMQIRTIPDTEQGEYILYKDGYFYIFIYALSLNSKGEAVPGFLNTSEIEKELSQFFERFEILRTTQK